MVSCQDSFETCPSSSLAVRRFTCWRLPNPTATLPPCDEAEQVKRFTTTQYVLIVNLNPIDRG
jgi:hypothetical protein